MGWKEDIAYINLALTRSIEEKLGTIKIIEAEEEGFYWKTGRFEYEVPELLSRREQLTREKLETELGIEPGTYRTSKLTTLPEGGIMASTDTMTTMRATGGFQLPTGFKGFLPLLLGFILVVFILIKK